MTLKSAMQDLQDRTLRAVSGLLGKLDYLASLRRPDGEYSHWGLERVHGEAATQRAFKEAHRGVVSKILRTPLRNLLRDVDESSGRQDVGPADFLKGLQEHSAHEPPTDSGAGTERHLSSVLHALLSLVKTRR
jgi:hypothetical protein